MKKQIKISERGQALILIVFAIVGLIGLTALTVDGGLAYSDRRHAQNAADTAAFAAARAKIRGEDWKATALNLAELNGYVDTDPGPASSSTMVNVEVYDCTEAHEPACGDYADEAYENPDEYIHVLITSTINTYFGKVIGVWQVTNRVNTVTHAQPGQPDPTSFGNAMESLMPGCNGDDGWNKEPYKVTGNSDITVTGSGVKVNSSCATYAITVAGNGDVNSAEGTCVVTGGGTNTSGGGTINPAPTSDCQQSPERQWPNPSCDLDGNGRDGDGSEDGSVLGSGGSWDVTAGYWDGDFPPSGVNGQLRMGPGIYCIEGGDFTVNSTLNVTSDLDGNGHELAEEGVLIFVKTGGISLNGTSSFDLHAISDPSAVDQFVLNLLFYLPPSNNSPVTITGNTGSVFTGSIWAPSSLVTLAGGGGTTVNSQVIGYSLEVSGGAGLTINYDNEQNAVSMSPASIELTE